MSGDGVTRVPDRSPSRIARVGLLVATLVIVGLAVVVSAAWNEPPQGDRLCGPGESCTVDGPPSTTREGP